MNTVTLYRITQRGAYRADEVGEWYSLTPYGANTGYYKGGDDGGKRYCLPEGYSIGRNAADEEMIFDAAGRAAALTMTAAGNPAVCVGGTSVRLWEAA